MTQAEILITTGSADHLVLHHLSILRQDYLQLKDLYTINERDGVTGNLCERGLQVDAWYFAKHRQVHIQEFHAERAAPRFLKVLIKKEKGLSCDRVLYTGAWLRLRSAFSLWWKNYASLGISSRLARHIQGRKIQEKNVDLRGYGGSLAERAGCTSVHVYPLPKLSHSILNFSTFF